MSIKLSREVINIINDKDSIILVSAVGKDGTPYNGIGEKVTIRTDGKIAYYELLESSQIQKNLVNSIWFQKEVAISVISKEKRHFVMKGLPYQALIAGNEFEQEYQDIQSEFGKNVDLSTVWLIEPREITEETYLVGKEREEENHPYLMHLDRVFQEDII